MHTFDNTALEGPRGVDTTELLNDEVTETDRTAPALPCRPVAAQGVRASTRRPSGGGGWSGSAVSSSSFGWIPGWRPRILTHDTRWVFQIGLLLAASQTEEWETLDDDRRRAVARIADVTNHYGKAFFVQRDLAKRLPTGTGRGRRSETGHVTEKTARKYINDICATNLLHDPIPTTFGHGRGANVYAWAKALIEQAWAFVRSVLGDGLPEFTERLKKSLRQLQRGLLPTPGSSRKRASGRLAGAPRTPSEPDADELLIAAGHSCHRCVGPKVCRGFCLSCLENAAAIHAAKQRPAAYTPMTRAEFHRVRQAASVSPAIPAGAVSGSTRICPPRRDHSQSLRLIWRRVFDWVTSRFGHYVEAVAS